MPAGSIGVSLCMWGSPYHLSRTVHVPVMQWSLIGAGVAHFLGGPSIVKGSMWGLIIHSQPAHSTQGIHAALGSAAAPGHCPGSHSPSVHPVLFRG